MSRNRSYDEIWWQFLLDAWRAQEEDQADCPNDTPSGMSGVSDWRLEDLFYIRNLNRRRKLSSWLDGECLGLSPRELKQELLLVAIRNVWAVFGSDTFSREEYVDHLNNHTTEYVGCVYPPTPEAFDSGSVDLPTLEDLLEEGVVESLSPNYHQLAGWVIRQLD